ncbi:class I SAM-dependent methyltransferase [Halioglobus sp.]|nr:class I SAM-dependent methyltransferase [Halioglobus sp.]
METAFSKQQYELFYPPGIENHWWTLARNKLLSDILRSDSEATDSLLEVGCGRGVVVQNLYDEGFDIHGVELADVRPLACVGARVDSGTDVFEWRPELRTQVTGLLLLDVIEHLPEVEPFLKKLGVTFPNLSLVVVTVPARKEIGSNYDAVVGHYRRYSLEMLEQLAANVGWPVGRTGYFFRVSYLPMRLMAMLGVNRNTHFKSPGKVMQHLHRIVSRVCTLEQRVLPGRVRGSSAYAVYHPTGGVG